MKRRNWITEDWVPLPDGFTPDLPDDLMDWFVRHWEEEDIWDWEFAKRMEMHNARAKPGLDGMPHSSDS
jgi:hypothetical protein